jgi:hypothetical protein
MLEGIYLSGDPELPFRLNMYEGFPSSCHVMDILPSNSDLVSTSVCYKSKYPFG